MKKSAVLLAGIFMVAVIGSAAFADQRNYGCGLGSMAFEGNDGLISQVSAVTTNASFSSQTFGITLGTSNCTQYREFTSNERLKVFVADNMDSLAKDISKGKGEYIDTLASLAGIPAKERAGFNATLQTNFSRIYTSETVTSLDVIKNIEKVVSAG